jgi:AraC-like DNA-binding protein
MRVKGHHGAAANEIGAEATHRLGGYREYAPPPALAHCAEALFVHRTPYYPATGAAAHRVLPDPAVSIGFMGFRRDNGEPIDWTPIVIGPKLRAQNFVLVPGRELAAIKIKPEWAGPLLDVDPMAIEERVDDLASIAPRLADRLGDALSRTRSAADVVQVMTAMLHRLRADCRTSPSAITSNALDLLRDTGGRTSCERAASTLGVSDRHLRRHVHDATGIAPKAYSRAVRFVGAMVGADRLDRPSWADLALSAGYCDQSHLIRDCIALAGVSPQKLHAERRQVVCVSGMSDLSNPA